MTAFLRLCLSSGLVFVALSGPAIDDSRPPAPLWAAFSSFGEVRDPAVGTAVQRVLYLPLLLHPNPFALNLPLWADSVPGWHDIVLFRRGFSLTAPLTGAALSIFADTRYEVWVDGRWVGRGPARFSKTAREYDRYALNDLQAGDHLIAVLVQWAPNARRSESATPLLLAHLEGRTGDEPRIILRTNTQWKALSSPAWRRDSALVHTLGLIGPTELLDLNQLPPDWFQPTFSDAAWPTAVVVESPLTADYQLRSIPLLVDAPVPATVIERGSLSPGRQIADLAPPVSSPYTLPFSLAASSFLTVEVLADPLTRQPLTMQVDGGDVVWSPAGSGRPDVYYTGMNVPVMSLSFLDEGVCL